MPDVARLEAARRGLGFTICDLWLEYMALGGHRDAANGANHPLNYRRA